jgi:hypothetical protein
MALSPAPTGWRPFRTCPEIRSVSPPMLAPIAFGLELRLGPTLAADNRRYYEESYSVYPTALA